MISPAPSFEKRNKRALVAEDSLLHQRLALSLLKRRGFEVTVVNNGQEATVAARDVGFDLILMDIEMPVLDGCAATRQIRALETKRGLHVPIVAVTSLEERDRILGAGMDAYLPKPLSSAALDDVLQGLAAGPACC